VKTLTLVVPCYGRPDQAARILSRTSVLESCVRKAGYELVETLLVDDGSEPPIPGASLRLTPNRGKGYAVRAGVLAAKGDFVLMSDADESTPFTAFPNLAAAMSEDVWMACGARRDRAGAPFVRRVLSRLFNLFVRHMGLHGVSDTQCGFKLFRMSCMRSVFEMLETERFAFDVELFLRVARAGGKFVEVPVPWAGRKRSTLRVWRDAPRMLADVRRMMRK